MFVMQVPLVPYLPFLSFMLNMALAIRLSYLTWVRVVVWNIAGNI